MAGFDDRTFSAAAWHWNGNRWRQESLPSPALGDGQILSNVITLPDGTVWAVGKTDFVNCCEREPVVLRKTPAGWRFQVAVSLESEDILVGGAAPHYATVVGHIFLGDSGDPRASTIPAIQSWTGTRWIKEEIQGFSQPQDTVSLLNAIDGDGHGGHWAVGRHVDQPLVIHRCVPSRRLG